MLSIPAEAVSFQYSQATVAKFHPLERSCPNRKTVCCSRSTGCFHKLWLFHFAFFIALWLFFFQALALVSGSSSHTSRNRACRSRPCRRSHTRNHSRRRIGRVPPPPNSPPRLSKPRPLPPSRQPPPPKKKASAGCAKVPHTSPTATTRAITKPIFFILCLLRQYKPWSFKGMKRSASPTTVSQGCPADA